MTIDKARAMNMLTVIVTTEDGEMPSGDFVTAPEGCMGKTVINATKVPGRVVVVSAEDTIYDSGEYVKDASGMTIKITGNTSAYNHDIKPYKIKLEKKGDLLGCGDKMLKDKEWRLLNNASLTTLVGNRLSELMGMAYTPQTALCNLFINGTCYGAFILSECVNRNADCRINVDKSEGYIIERDPYWWAESVYFDTPFYAKDKSYRWTFKYPDDKDVTDSIMASIRQYATAAENTIYSPVAGGKSYGDYFDIASLADWLLIHDMLGTRDSGGANMYYHKYDSKTDTLLHMPVMWDFDTSFECDTASYSRIHTSSHGYYTTLFKHADGHFAAYYKKRYTDIGEAYIDSLIAFLKEFKTSDTAAELQSSRNASNNNRKVSVEADNIISWLKGHKAWMTRNVRAMKVDESLYSSETVDNTLTEGREMFYDRLTDSYLCSVPKECFDDGRVGEYLASQTATTGRKDFTYLPIVHLKGDFGYDYTEGTVSVIMPDGTSSQTNLKAKLKWRGGTTNVDGKHKRNYSVKFLTASGDKQDRKFFGLRNDNHWILDAGQVDMSRIRNRVATDLWNDMDAKPYYADLEPKARTGTRGQFVEVFLNDEYRGIYCMTECIDRSQLKLKKYTDNADGTQTIHGQLWKSGGYKYAGFRDYGDYDNTSETWGSFEVKYPEIDDVCPNDWSTLYDAVKWTADNDFDDWNGEGDEKEYYDRVTTDIRNNIANYFDMPVITAYELFIMMMNAVDNSNGKNIYWACYDKQVDKKLTIAVWDLDATVGQNFNPNNRFPDYVQPTNIPTHNLVHVFLSYLRSPLTGEMSGKTFNEIVADKYKLMRSDIFSADSLKSRYHAYMEMLRQSGAYARETQRWSGDSDIGGEQLDFDKEEAYINDWIDKRLDFLDGYFVYDGIEEITADGAASANDVIYDLQGRRVTKPGKGIFLKSKNSRIQKFKN